MDLTGLKIPQRTPQPEGDASGIDSNMDKVRGIFKVRLKLWLFYDMQTQ